jgi:hypothetical protein
MIKDYAKQLIKMITSLILLEISRDIKVKTAPINQIDIIIKETNVIDIQIITMNIPRKNYKIVVKYFNYQIILQKLSQESPIFIIKEMMILGVEDLNFVCEIFLFFNVNFY